MQCGKLRLHVCTLFSIKVHDYGLSGSNKSQRTAYISTVQQRVTTHT